MCSHDDGENELLVGHHSTEEGREHVRLLNSCRRTHAAWQLSTYLTCPDLTLLLHVRYVPSSCEVQATSWVVHPSCRITPRDGHCVSVSALIIHAERDRPLRHQPFHSSTLTLTHLTRDLVDVSGSFSLRACVVCRVSVCLCRKLGVTREERARRPSSLLRD